MSPRTFLGFFSITTLVAASLAGCGGSVTGGGGNGGNGGGSGGGDTSTSTSTSSGSTTSTTSSTSTSTSTSSSSSGDPCVPFVTPPPPTMPVTVRLVNKTNSNVYLGQTTPTCSMGLGFTLEDANMMQLKPSRDACEYTCEELQQGSCACAADCAAPIVTLLAPSGHYDIGWPATVFESAPMPSSCYQDQSCVQPSCLMEEAPPPGPLTMKSSAWTMAMGCPGGTCQDCTPSAMGNCTIFNAMTVGGTELKGKVQWMGEGLVEIDFM